METAKVTSTFNMSSDMFVSKIVSQFEETGTLPEMLVGIITAHLEQSLKNDIAILNKLYHDGKLKGDFQLVYEKRVIDHFYVRGILEKAYANLAKDLYNYYYDPFDGIVIEPAKGREEICNSLLNFAKEYYQHIFNSAIEKLGLQVSGTIKNHFVVYRESLNSCVYDTYKGDLLIMTSRNNTDNNLTE